MEEEEEQGGENGEHDGLGWKIESFFLGGGGNSGVSLDGSRKRMKGIEALRTNRLATSSKINSRNAVEHYLVRCAPSVFVRS